MPVRETFYWGDMIITHSINAEVVSNTLGSVLAYISPIYIYPYKKVRSLRFINKELYRLIQSQTSEGVVWKLGTHTVQWCHNPKTGSDFDWMIVKTFVQIIRVIIRNFSRTVVWYSADRMLAWSECGLQIFVNFSEIVFPFWAILSYCNPKIKRSIPPLKFFIWLLFFRCEK